MGGVDIIDQIRKMFGIDLTHKTLKWTVRFLEVNWSLILAHRYNIHRKVNEARPTRRLNHTDFKWQVFKELMTDPIVMAAPEAQAVDRNELKQFEPGSKDDGTMRRMSGDCRVCPRTTRDIHGHLKRNFRRTTYYCILCKVCYHPACYNKYHTENCLNHLPENIHPAFVEEV